MKIIKLLQVSAIGKQSNYQLNDVTIIVHI